MEALIIFGVIAAFIVLSVWLGGQNVRRMQRAVSAGVPARGLILEIARTGANVQVGGQRYESRTMCLDIEMPGRPPYMLRCAGLIPKMMVRICLPGTFVDLRIDPRNASTIAIVGPGGVFFAE